MTIDTVPVALGERSYEVRIGRGLIAGAGTHLAPLLTRPRVAILTDETVAAIHLPPFVSALEGAGILISLLPDTPGTRDLLDAGTLALLPSGATIINPGRGTLIVEADLLAALDRGQVGLAVLDVFQTEPLPPAHAFWSHPRVIVTPHIAAETRPSTAAPVVAENLRRAMDGRALLHLVDRARGY